MATNNTTLPPSDDETLVRGAPAEAAPEEHLTETEREGNRRAFRLGYIEDEITGLLDELDYDRVSPMLETVLLAALIHGRDVLQAAKLDLEAAQ